MKKMMKQLFLSLVAAMMAITATFAQNTLVATLSHGENISAYYGSFALRDAMDAAVSGDVINLSGGAFQAADITKGITLRGTGIDDAAPTYISGDFTINVPTNDANCLSMEGIRSTGNITMAGTFNSPYFVKSQFNAFSYNTNAAIKNAMFVNCKITNYFTMAGTSTSQFINSYISKFRNDVSDNTTASFVNSILSPCTIQIIDYGSYRYVYRADLIQRSILLNCIICINGDNNNDYNKLNSTSVATNCTCLGKSNPNVFFSANPANKGCGYSVYAQTFKDFNGEYSDSQTFELTEEAKTWKGSDGTEMGLYGGYFPYNSTPSYPQITKMNVADRSTADGKLSLEVEVSAAE